MTAYREHPQQVVPAALRAHLDNVASEFTLVTSELADLTGDECPPTRRKPGTEREGDVYELRFYAYGTRRGRLAPDVASNTQKFGLGVTNVKAAQTTASVLAYHGLPHQAVLDPPGMRRSTCTPKAL